jgi:hypothetical protein
VHRDNYGVYGTRKIWLQLNRDALHGVAAKTGRLGRGQATGRGDLQPLTRQRAPRRIAGIFI